MSSSDDASSSCWASCFPPPSDVPLLTTMYQDWAAKADDGTLTRRNPTGELNDVGAALMRFVQRNWTDVVKEWDPPVALGYLENHDGNRIEERREGEAEHAQHLFLHWLIKHGVTDDHKILAYQAAMQPRGNWPRFTVTVEMRRRLTNDLIATSNQPEFRVKLIPVVAQLVDPTEFLNAEEEASVRLAALREMAKRAESEWTSYSNARYTTVQRYLRTVKDIAADEDELPKMQNQAKRLQRRFERWLEEK